MKAAQVLVGAALALQLLAACSRESRGAFRTRPDGMSAPAQATAGSGSPSSSGPVENSDNPGVLPMQSDAGLMTPPPPAAGTGSITMPADGCIGTSVSAPPAGKPKVDVIWVVDASASMLDEQMRIGANLTGFADAVSMADIDIHIVMLTTSASIPVVCPEIPPDPLSGTPLAMDASRYLFVPSLVTSQNALDIAVDNFPMYMSFLRPDAVTHFVVVSDDESTYRAHPTPEERASAFKMDMQNLLGRPFTFHTVASEGPTACRDPNCMPDTNTGICAFIMLGCGAAMPGNTYYALAAMTNGLTASICQSDWKPIFEPLTNAVIDSAPLPCEYQIPPAPAGEHLDPKKVNVRWTAPSAMDAMLFGKAGDSGSCGDALGWFYDDESAPTKVQLCPSTCTTIAVGGTIDISYGCNTIVLN